MTRQGTWAGMYCNTATALAIQHGLGAAGAGGARTGRAGSRQALGGLGARRWADWVLGAGARGSRRKHAGSAAAGAAGARGACDLGAGHAASAHLGVPAGPAGCSCTRLGFSTWFSTR